MTNPADQSAPEPPVDRQAAATGDDFTVELPWSHGDEIRHVVHLRGDQLAFTDAYEAFVETASADAAPLFVPAEQRDLGAVRVVLDSLGGGTVTGIDAVPA